jgi:hypothetical protein
MRFLSTVSDYWLGLCRKVPVVRASWVVIDNQPEPVYVGSPDGGAGGPGTIRRGVGAGLSGTKTLIHNPQLLWFSLLIGIVLAGHSFARGVLSGLSSSLDWQFFFDPSITQVRFFVDPYITSGGHSLIPPVAVLLSSFIVTFALELSTVFCLVFLLAGLALSLSQEKGGSVSFFHELTMAKKYLRSLTGWSVVVALAGSLLFTAGQKSYLLDWTWFQPFDMISRFLISVLNQNPFNYVLTPNLNAAIFPDWAFGIYSAPIYNGLLDTLILSAVNVFLFVLTLFVVPLLVLERKSLKEAVSGSFSLMKKIWGEVAACILGLGMVVFAALLLSLLFQVAAGGNIAVDYYPPPTGWLAAGILYVLALSSLVVVAATVGGIAALDLYRSAKTGLMTEAPET